MTWFAVFYQETGEEGILHPEEGETLEQLLERAPEEWRFRYTEEPKDYSRIMDLEDDGYEFELDW